MPNLISRAQWGARPASGSGNAINAKPLGVAIHYEGPKMGRRDHARCKALVQSIQRYHQVNKGWADVAYNFLVCEHGYIYEGRGIGKGSAANGTTLANARYYAICALVGEGDATPDAMLAGIRDAVLYVRARGAGQAVTGHRDHFATACPGTPLYNWLKAGMPVTGAAPARPVTVSRGEVRPALVPASKPAPGLPAFPGVSRPSSRVSGATRAFQTRLKARGWVITVDGVHGNATTAIIRRFQTEKHLRPVDGIGGPATWVALWKASVT